MAFDFPSSPTNGQTYTAHGVTYRYNGQAWDRQQVLASNYILTTGKEADRAATAGLNGHHFLALDTTNVHRHNGANWLRQGRSHLSPYRYIFSAEQVGFNGDSEFDNAPVWNSFMEYVRSLAPDPCAIYFEDAYNYYRFNSRPIPVPASCGIFGSPAVFGREYQAGILRTPTNISVGAANGTGGFKVRITMPTHTIANGQSVWVANVMGPLEANGYYNATVVNSTQVDLDGTNAGGGAVSNYGYLLEWPEEPFIEMGKALADDPMGHNSYIHGITLLPTGPGYIGGVALSMGCAGSDSGGEAAAYNCEVDHLFVSLSGNNDWFIAAKIDGSTNHGHVSFRGSRNNKMGFGAMYGGRYASMVIRSGVATRINNVNLLGSGTPQMIGSLLIEGNALVPNYSTKITAEQISEIYLADYCTISDIHCASIASVTMTSGSSGNRVVGYSSGAPHSIFGTQNLVEDGHRRILSAS